MGIIRTWQEDLWARQDGEDPDGHDKKTPDELAAEAIKITGVEEKINGNGNKTEEDGKAEIPPPPEKGPIHLFPNFQGKYPD